MSRGRATEPNRGATVIDLTPFGPSASTAHRWIGACGVSGSVAGRRGTGSGSGRSRARTHAADPASGQQIPEVYAAFPGLAIFLVVMGFNLLGDGLRDVLDPRLRRAGQHGK